MFVAHAIGKFLGERVSAHAPLPEAIASRPSV